MEAEFAKLAPQYQQMIAGSPDGLEMLYWKVKGQQTLSQADGQRQIGANQAYQTMGQKVAMSNTPGSAPVKTALSRASIGQMDTKEYTARRTEIFDAMAKGLIN